MTFTESLRVEGAVEGGRCKSDRVVCAVQRAAGGRSRAIASAVRRAASALSGPLTKGVTEKPPQTPPMASDLLARAAGDCGHASVRTQQQPALIAGIGVLLLAMGVGGTNRSCGLRFGKGATSAGDLPSAPPPGAAGAAVTPTTTTPAVPIPSSTAKKAAKAKEPAGAGSSITKPAPPSAAQNLRSGGTGQSYEQKSKNLPNVVSTGRAVWLRAYAFELGLRRRRDQLAERVAELHWNSAGSPTRWRFAIIPAWTCLGASRGDAPGVRDRTHRDRPHPGAMIDSLRRWEQNIGELPMPSPLVWSALIAAFLGFGILTGRVTGSNSLASLTASRTP